MPREYLPTLIIAVIWTIIFVWFRIFELPRIRRERKVRPAIASGSSIAD